MTQQTATAGIWTYYVLYVYCRCVIVFWFSMGDAEHPTNIEHICKHFIQVLLTARSVRNMIACPWMSVMLTTWSVRCVTACPWRSAMLTTWSVMNTRHWPRSTRLTCSVADVTSPRTQFMLPDTCTARARCSCSPILALLAHMPQCLHSRHDRTAT